MTFDLLSSVYKKGRASLFIVRLILLSLCPLFSLVGVILSLVFLNRSNKVALSVLFGICLFLFLSSLFFILVSILGPEIKERNYSFLGLTIICLLGSSPSLSVLIPLKLFKIL